MIHNQGPDVKTCARCRILLISLHQPAKNVSPSRTFSQPPNVSEVVQAALGFGQLYDFEFDPLRFGCSGSLRPGIALIDEGEGNVFAEVLDCLSQATDFRTVVCVGRCDVQGQQMAQRIGPHVHFRPALAFGAVIARTWAAFRRRTQGPAVDDGNTRLGRSRAA